MDDNIREWTGLEFGKSQEGKMEKTGCKIICGAPTTLAVKGLMMMMMLFPVNIHMHHVMLFPINIHMHYVVLFPSNIHMHHMVLFPVNIHMHHVMLFLSLIHI